MIKSIFLVAPAAAQYSMKLGPSIVHSGHRFGQIRAQPDEYTFNFAQAKYATYGYYGNMLDYCVDINWRADGTVIKDAIDEYGCQSFNGYYKDYPEDCGVYDTDEFSAIKMCCHCGGGADQSELPPYIPKQDEHYRHCTDKNSFTWLGSDGVEYEEVVEMRCANTDERYWCEEEFGGYTPSYWEQRTE